MVDRSNYDLNELYESDNTFGSFSKLISGKSNYKTIREKKKEAVLCSQCKFQLKGKEKFCPECGNKLEMATLNVNSPPETPKSL